MALLELGKFLFEVFVRVFEELRGCARVVWIHRRLFGGWFVSLAIASDTRGALHELGLRECAIIYSNHGKREN